MIFAKYNSYKDSGVKWLGKIPSYWELKRIKDIARLNPYTFRSLNFDNSEKIEFLPMSQVNEMEGKIKKFLFKPFGIVKSGYTTFKNGDILFAKITPCMENGNCVIVQNLKKNLGFGSTEFIVFRTDPSLRRYLYLFLRNKQFLKKAEFFMTGSAGQKRISTSYLNVHPIGLPTGFDKIKITNLLDKKTSQIDKKIKLLQEKKESYVELKKSLINATVCRGIDKNVELKDSGIEWIGKIPKHWKVERGKDRFFYEKKINKELICKNVLSLTYGGVINKDFDTVAGLNPGSYKTYQFVNKDDLIFKLIDLENIKTSRVGIVHEHGVMSSAYIRLNPKRSTFSRYYYYLYFFYYRINLFNYLGGGVRSTLNYSNLLEIPIISSQSKEEQIQIANYLDEKTSKIDKIVSKINNQIETLKEFRKTLINDIVTGKERVQDE